MPPQLRRRCFSMVGEVEAASNAATVAAVDALLDCDDGDGDDDIRSCQAATHCDCSEHVRAQLAEARRTARQLAQEKVAFERKLAETIHVVEVQNLTIQSLRAEVAERQHESQHLTHENDELLEDYHAVSAENDELQSKLQLTRDKASEIVAKGNELLEERDWLLEQLEQRQREVRDMVTADEVSEIVNQIGEQWRGKMKEAASERAALELKLETVALERDARQGRVDEMEQERRAMHVKIDALSKARDINNMCVTANTQPGACSFVKTRKMCNKGETTCEKGEATQELITRQKSLSRIFRTSSKRNVIKAERPKHMRFASASMVIGHEQEKPACAPQKLFCEQQKQGINLKCSGKEKSAVVESFLHSILSYY